VPVDLLIVVHLLVLELEAVNVLTLLVQVLVVILVAAHQALHVEVHLVHLVADTLADDHQVVAALLVATVVAEADVDVAEL
jgi:hypothetical protein